MNERVYRVVFLALIAALLVVSCSKKSDSQGEAPKAAAESEEKAGSRSESAVTLDESAQKDAGITAEPVRSRPIQQSLRITGTVSANESKIAHIRTLANGRIEKVYVRFGDQVRAGQRLATFDNIELGNAIGDYLGALSALNQATTQADVGRKSAERAQELIKLGAIAKAEMERREADYRNALAAIDSQRAALQKIEFILRRFGMSDAEIDKIKDSSAGARSLTRSSITAPFSGVVTKYNIAEGEAISPETDLMVITDLSNVWVLGNVYEKDLHLIREGAPAFVRTSAYPEKQFSGIISHIGDFLNPDTRTASVRCEVPNVEGLLKLDMFADIEVLTGLRREALVISPASAQTISGKQFVFVKAGPERFEAREVKLGPERGGLMEVMSGLNAGDLIVTQGAFSLKSQLLRSQIGGEESEEKEGR